MNQQTILESSQLTSLGIKETTRRIREQLKKDFEDCTFSVSFETYSGGGTIKVALMKSKTKIIRDFKDVSERALDKLGDHCYKVEQVKGLQEKKYHQLTQYHLKDEYEPDDWNNGVFLTKEAHELLVKVNQIIRQYRYDNSDPQTDYFDTNFYYDIHIGKWDKDFVQG